MSDKKDKEEEIRRKDNDDLIKRMQKGENLTRYDSSASWFPPRPNIIKDPVALSQLYKNSQTSQKKQNDNESTDDEDKTISASKTPSKSHLKIL